MYIFSSSDSIIPSSHLIPVHIPPSYLSISFYHPFRVLISYLPTYLPPPHIKQMSNETTSQKEKPPTHARSKSSRVTLETIE
ncbi:hypothetical protein EYC84_006444 [Monilinia fructicola]|uniref:Uncharacterized protein n=1 Tax=Monilinia fructicola TaxID=38448 RepID=A0A5M9K7W3_MONFR|nr:hypothetical protein EYC84_006444 [Monilinia fructicola]